MLDRIVKIVYEASKLFGGEFEISSKGASNYVTNKDIAIEKFLRSALNEAIDGLGIIGEEGENHSDALSHEYTAVIDPIDGTMNFTRNMHLSAISVALLKRGKPHIGVVYMPDTDEMFAAEVGKGATLNGKKISVTDNGIDKACFFTAWSTYNKDYAPQCFAITEEIYYKIDDIRRLGSAALELCYLAAGRGEMFFEMRLSPWDFAAAVIIASEAGGYVGTLEQPEFDYTRMQPVLAANSKENYEYLHTVVKKHIPKIPYNEKRR